MLGRQSVRVTYAHKRRRVQNVNKKLFSSPLEVLPADVGDLTRTQMVRRMLKRSRRTAFAEQFEDKNVEYIREHLAKRIKHAQERVSNVELGVPLIPQDDVGLQTPFPSSPFVHESVVARPLVPEPLSPVPVAKRGVPRTSSRNLKENSAYPQSLASPFCSRPGSAASSPRRNGKGRSSRRVPHRSLHAKSRTLSGVMKEDGRQVARKDSTRSLKDINKGPSRHAKHQRFPSHPSTSYMRSQFVQEDWSAPPKAFSRTINDYDEDPSLGEFVHSSASFYADEPRSCSTPAKSRVRNVSNLRDCPIGTDNTLASFSPCMVSTEAGDVDIGMMDDTVPPRRQTIHLSRNSIFSSSDEFTMEPLPPVVSGGTASDKNNIPGQFAEAPARVVRSPRSGTIDKSQAGRSLAGSFIAEYYIPIPHPTFSLALTATTRVVGPEAVDKLPVGEMLINLPGTSPAHGGNLIIHAARKSGAPTPVTSPPRTTISPMSIAPTKMVGPEGVPKLSVGEVLAGLPGTSPARGGNLVIRAAKNPGLPTLVTSLSRPTTCPPSPASDLTQGFGSMAIHVCPPSTIYGAGDADTHSDGDAHRPSASVLQACSRSLQGTSALVGSTTKAVIRRPGRNRAGTVRASDFAKSGVSSSDVAPELSVSSFINVRRTRSGTVVGPDAKLGTKGADLPSRSAKGVAPPAGLATIQSQSESESDDELLLKAAWIEDLEYLGFAVPPWRQEAEADEINLGGLWHGLESGPPPHRLEPRRR